MVSNPLPPFGPYCNEKYAPTDSFPDAGTVKLDLSNTTDLQIATMLQEISTGLVNETFLLQKINWIFY